MKKLNAYNECNEREINAMVGKAACAWANWQVALDNPHSKELQIAYKNEYEATIRCIDMFVKNDLYEIQAIAIEEAREMMAA